MQYIECEFKPGSRPYTYQNEGAPLAVDDWVVVNAPRDEGLIAIKVVAVDVPEPSFSCKSVVQRCFSVQQDGSTFYVRDNEADTSATIEAPEDMRPADDNDTNAAAKCRAWFKVNHGPEYRLAPLPSPEELPK